MKSRKVNIAGQVEKCDRGCGEKIAKTVREDDGATRVSTIRDGHVMPGPHGGTCMGTTR